MSDVRDMLGISGGGGGGGGAAAAASSSSASGFPRSAAALAPGSSSRSGAPGASPSASAAAKSLVPRELAQLRSELSWNGAFPMAPASAAIHSLAGIKAKRVKAVSWKNMPIRSSARTQRTGKMLDDVDLLHWVKIHNVPDYRFARFNKAIRMLEYSSEEFAAYLHDPDWSRAETDRLMDCAKEFDLRFIIMEDRYNQRSDMARKEEQEAKLPAVDPTKLAAAQAELQRPPRHAGESKAEANERAAASANNITISDNTTVAIPAAESKSDEASNAMDTSEGAASAAAVGAPAATTADGQVVAASAAAPTEASSVPSASSFAAGVFPYRSVEQLKARFYSIQKTLTSIRNSSDPDLAKTNPLWTHPYDPGHEVLRKAQLERLYQRTSSEVDSMAETVLEHKRISGLIKKIKKGEKEARDLVRGVKGPKAARGTSAAASSATMMMSSNKKRGSTTGAVGGSMGGGAPRRSNLPVVMGEMAPVPAGLEPTSIFPVRPSGSVYLRSTQLNHPLILSARQSKILETELANMNIKKSRDLMVPTGVVCELWDKVRLNILTLASMQQYVREKETMRDDLKMHAAAAPSAAASAAAAAPAAYAPIAAPSPMMLQPQRQLSDNAASAAASTVSTPSSAAAQAAAAEQAMRKKQQEKRRLEGGGGEQASDQAQKKKK